MCSYDHQRSKLAAPRPEENVAHGDETHRPVSCGCFNLILETLAGFIEQGVLRQMLEKHQVNYLGIWQEGKRKRIVTHHRNVTLCSRCDMKPIPPARSAVLKCFCGGTKTTQTATQSPAAPVVTANNPPRLLFLTHVFWEVFFSFALSRSGRRWLRGERAHRRCSSQQRRVT